MGTPSPGISRVPSSVGTRMKPWAGDRQDALDNKKENNWEEKQVYVLSYAGKSSPGGHRLGRKVAAQGGRVSLAADGMSTTAPSLPCLQDQSPGRTHSPPRKQSRQLLPHCLLPHRVATPSHARAVPSSCSVLPWHCLAAGDREGTAAESEKWGGKHRMWA